MVKHIPPSQRPELFLIHDDCLDAVSIDEVKATIADMSELGVNHLPFPKVDIQTKFFTLTNLLDEVLGGNMTERAKQIHSIDDLKGIRYRFVNDEIDSILFMDNDRVVREYKSYESLYSDTYKSVWRVATEDQENRAKMCTDIYYHTGYCFRDILVVLLATKNVVKRRMENKALRLGVGLSNEFKSLYTTSLSVPSREAMINDTENPPREGRSPRAHLRRGHIRGQHYGPRNSYLKKVFIQPVFVNADESFVSTRVRYNMSMKENVI